MSARAVLISLAVSCVLALGAVGVYLPELRARGGAAGPAISLRPGEVRALELREGDAIRRIERRGGQWILYWDDGGRKGIWVCDEARARGAIRLLLEGVVRSESVEVSDDGAATLVVESESGSWEVVFGPAGVGGVVPTRVRGPDGQVVGARCERSVRDLFTHRGMLAWRSQAAIAPGDGMVRRVILRSGGGEIRLAQVRGRWVMLEPVSAPADEMRCRQLVGVLGALELTGFEEGLGDDAAMGLDDPEAVISVERGGLGSSGGEMVESRLAVGMLANAEGTERFVRSEQREILRDGQERVVLGPVIGRVRVDAIDEIAAAPEAYLSRRCMEGTIADVRSVAVRRAGAGGSEVFTRGLGGWQQDEQHVRAVLAERLDGLMDLLFAQSSPQVELAKPEGWRTLGEVELRSLDGASLARIEVGVVEREEGVAALGLVHDGIVRLYPSDSLVDLIVWFDGG